MPRGLLDAFSARTSEVAAAAERFRAKWGRAPERGELRRLKLENRKAKVLVTRGDLHAVWNDTAARFGFTGDEPVRLLAEARGSRPERALSDRVEERLTERAGPARARELVMTGALYDAATLERWNVVNRVLPDAGFDAAARRFHGVGFFDQRFIQIFGATLLRFECGLKGRQIRGERVGARD